MTSPRLLFCLKKVHIGVACLAVRAFESCQGGVTIRGLLAYVKRQNNSVLANQPNVYSGENSRKIFKHKKPANSLLLNKRFTPPPPFIQLDKIYNIQI